MLGQVIVSLVALWLRFRPFRKVTRRQALTQNDVTGPFSYQWILRVG